MMLKTTKLDIWAKDIDDRPGGLATTLQTIADSGAELECVLARRDPTRTGRGMLFVTPLHGNAQLESARELGMRRTEHLHTLKVEGEDRPGMGAELAKVIGETGVNMHGLTAVVVGHKFVCYASFDTVADLEKAEHAIHTLESKRFPRLRAIMRRATEGTPLPT